MKKFFQFRLFYLAILLGVLTISCSDENDNGGQTLESMAALSTQIDSLTAKLSQPMSNAEAKELSIDLMANCIEFADAFPQDNRCPDYLFIASRAANGLGEYDNSLKYLNRIKKGYRGYVKMPEVYFLYAFTLDEELDRKEDAKNAYMELINTFPDDPLSAQASILMDQLYMSDQELIEMWKMKEKANS
jgi:tetratricopeptide (TPR) repeat protein